MILIKFPTDGTSRISVYKDEKVLLFVDRKFCFGSKIKAEFYQDGSKIAVVTNVIFSIKIIFQAFNTKIKNYKNGLFSSIFVVNNDKIKVLENPLYFLYPKYYSKIYWNNILIANVEMQKIIDFRGITLEIKFDTNDDDIQYYSIISYLMTCLNVNI
jgi:hypothetical protein